MADSQNPRPDHPVSEAADLFSLLGDQARLEIVTVLQQTDRDSCSFSALHESVSLTDSGQFNYHLSKLVPRFVSKTDEGYRLTSAGRRVARAVAAGYYTETATFDPVETGGTCVFCGEQALRATYTDEHFHIDCEACDAGIISVQAPPTLVIGRSPDAALDTFHRWSLNRVQQVYRDGICPYCGGPVEPTHSREYLPDQFDIVPVFRCQACTGRVVTSYGALAGADREVAAMLDWGGRHDERRYWELEQYVTDRNVEITNEEPFRVTVTCHENDEICCVVFDETHDIVHTTVDCAEGSC